MRARELAWSLVGAACALTPALWLMERAESPLFLASVGGSTVFVFGLTSAPAAQPRALLGGHLLSAAIGVACLQWLGPGLATMVIAVLVAMLVMLVTRTVHPPAGANPLLIVHAGAGWSALVLPIGACLAVLVVVAWAWSRARPGPAYPRDWRAPSPADGPP